MKDLILIKNKVDALAAAGSKLDSEDIIHHILNRLSLQYQRFKSAIRINLQPLRLDDFYSLIYSEETNLVVEAQRDLLTATNQSHKPATTLYSARERGRISSCCGKSSPNNYFSQTPPKSRDQSNPFPTTCQIYQKGDTPRITAGIVEISTTSPPTQYATNTEPPTSQPEWFFDTDATSHLTPDPNLLHNPQPYLDNYNITVGNGNSIPITHIDQGTSSLSPSYFNSSTHL